MLVDAGPLVALLDQGDPEHEDVIAAFKTVRDPLVTVWPAFTEAMYLLRGSWRGQKALWSRLETDALRIRRRVADPRHPRGLIDPSVVIDLELIDAAD